MGEVWRLQINKAEYENHYKYFPLSAPQELKIQLNGPEI